jgi:hypothetical protein
MADDIRLSGVWEREGRNPAVGAVILVLALGSLYFLLQTVAQGAFLAGDVVFGREISPDRLSRVYRPVILTMLVVTQFGLFFGAALAFIRRWHTKDLIGYLRLRRVPIVGLIAAGVGVLGLLPAVDRIARFLYDLVPELRELTESTAFLTEADGPGELVFLLLTLAVTPAICEELLFRAYLQRTLERKMRAPWHFLVSGALFALFHQQVLTLPSLVLVGIYLSYLCYVFASPFPSVFAHFLFNGVQLVPANADVSIPAVFGPAGFTWMSVLVGLVLVAASIAVSVRTRL